MKKSLTEAATTIENLRNRESSLREQLVKVQQRISQETDALQRRLREGEPTENEYHDNVLDIWQTNDPNLIAAWQQFRETLRKYAGQMFIIATHEYSKNSSGEDGRWKFRSGLISTETYLRQLPHRWTELRPSHKPVVILPCNPDISDRESSYHCRREGGYNAGSMQIGREKLRLFLLHQLNWTVRFIQSEQGIIQEMHMLIGDKAVRAFPVWKEERFDGWLERIVESLRRVRKINRRMERKWRKEEQNATS